MPLLKILDSISSYEENEQVDNWVEQHAREIMMNLDSNELKELIHSLEIICNSIKCNYH
jgi:hypothetical protein